MEKYKMMSYYVIESKKGLHVAKLSTCVWLSLLWLSPVMGAPLDLYAFASDNDSRRFEKLTQELRCLVCQNQSLADSDAPLAKDLRQKIYVLMNEKKSDQDIKQYLVGRYGDFILFSPPFSVSTLLLWGFPALLLAMVFGAIFIRQNMLE